MTSEWIATKVESLRILLGRTIGEWMPAGTETKWRPRVHLCNEPISVFGYAITVPCWFWCCLSLHSRVDDEDKCRCCTRRDWALIKEMAECGAIDWERDERFSTRWWEAKAPGNVQAAINDAHQVLPESLLRGARR